jgi:CheY-like chemotaxis protein
MDSNNPHVLVVEDDADIREAVDELLTGEGYRVTGVTNGAEALAHLGEGVLPDLVLLDMRMPKLDGHAFLERVRAVPSWQHLKIVVVSAELDRPTGVTGYVRKPFDIAILLKEIARAL